MVRVTIFFFIMHCIGGRFHLILVVLNDFSDMQQLRADEQFITQMKLAYEKQLQSERTLKTQVKHGKHQFTEMSTICLNA